VKRGVITPNANLLLGPDIGDGSFKAAAIKSIVSTACLHHPAGTKLLTARGVIIATPSHAGTATPACAKGMATDVAR
jgi:GTPase